MPVREPRNLSITTGRRVHGFRIYLLIEMAFFKKWATMERTQYLHKGIDSKKDSHGDTRNIWSSSPAVVCHGHRQLQPLDADNASAAVLGSPPNLDGRDEHFSLSNDFWEWFLQSDNHYLDNEDIQTAIFGKTTFGRSDKMSLTPHPASKQYYMGLIEDQAAALKTAKAVDATANVSRMMKVKEEEDATVDDFLFSMSTAVYPGVCQDVVRPTVSEAQYYRNNHDYLCSVLNNVDTLTAEELSRYLYVPMTEAAKGLFVDLKDTALAARTIKSTEGEDTVAAVLSRTLATATLPTTAPPLQQVHMNNSGNRACDSANKKDMKTALSKNKKISAPSAALILSPLDEASSEHTTSHIPYQSRRPRPPQLTFEEVSCYFHLPITLAAKELNVGLTVLKHNCRKLGIPRWPHRKLRSIQALISNLYMLLGTDGGVTDNAGNCANTSLKRAVEMLEEEKRNIERNPSVGMHNKTKKMRQHCFKAVHKLRRKEKMNSASTECFSKNSALTVYQRSRRTQIGCFASNQVVVPTSKLPHVFSCDEQITS